MVNCLNVKFLVKNEICKPDQTSFFKFLLLPTPSPQNKGKSAKTMSKSVINYSVNKIGMVSILMELSLAGEFDLKLIINIKCLIK